MTMNHDYTAIFYLGHIANSPYVMAEVIAGQATKQSDVNAREKLGQVFNELF